MRLWIAITALTLAMCLSLILFMLLPPQSLTLAAGARGGAYALMAERYKEVLARDDIDVTIVYTDGSVDNAALLTKGEIDAAFVQAGVHVPMGKAEAIGGVFYEPMIFLARKGHDIPSNPALWRDLRISSGRPGSGTSAAFEDFQKAVGMAQGANKHLALGFAQSVFALEAGGIDLAFLVSSIEAPYLTQAFASEEITLLQLAYTEAISRHLDYADIVQIPTGAVSLAPVQPEEAREMLALKAQLAIAPDLHPALVNRLTMAAKELHRGRDLLTDRGTFPSPYGIGMPINSVARQLIQDGPSTWHNLLPYWAAAQVNRLLLLTLPILLLLVPLLRVVPSLYAYFRGWQVWKHYGRIREIEAELSQHGTMANLTLLAEDLEAVDHRIAQLRLPPAYRQTAYHARMHIDLVRKRIRQMEDQTL
ncbi:TAXI family TRAP transporter solute-binding subunit [Shimia marina]|uniref:TRAP transporter solute receptor, TAXI family n=1 Tax=Shimia marina TaxID=321267 RepID=A0A0N7LRE8_9RHOB|nr:TAXI family TRAP transporter solute-binding subunit [Shimia marina]CUH50620.1 TRAP transporter solute receptor, TAXI family [Shimia marina]SFE38697.1 TRAP-type uncharacterized transport system, substrate-binding protein [Shimia marina]